VEKEKCNDCPGECSERECSYVRELADGRVVSISCRGTCHGRCAGCLTPPDDDVKLPAAGAGAKPDSGSRVRLRSRELYFEAEEGSRGDSYEVSCAVGCVVGHARQTPSGQADCYGSCLGICYGVARVEELAETAAPGFEE
jgi:hypothetical protein